MDLRLNDTEQRFYAPSSVASTFLESLICLELCPPALVTGASQLATTNTIYSVPNMIDVNGKAMQRTCFSFKIQGHKTHLF